MSRRYAVAVVVALVGLVAGCGGSGSGKSSSTAKVEQLVSRGEVAAQPAGSPQRALFAWWRNAQYVNGPAFSRAFVPTLQANLLARKDLAAELTYFGRSIRSAKPKILYVDAGKSSATIFTKLAFRQAIGSKRFVTNTVPQAFTFSRARGRWLLADSTFFDATVVPYVARTTTTP